MRQNEHWDSCDGHKQRWYFFDGTYRVLCECQAAKHGWCIGCRTFCAGFEHYDFSPFEGFCGDCAEQFEHELEPSTDGEYYEHY